jgi:hypothetical protein
VVHEQREDLRLSFKMMESSFMRDFEGRWSVRRLPSGAGSVVVHELAVMPFMELPGAVEGYMQSIFSSQVSAILRDLHAELGRRQQQQGQGQGGQA